jgi:hypothetical protein
VFQCHIQATFYEAFAEEGRTIPFITKKYFNIFAFVKQICLCKPPEPHHNTLYIKRLLDIELLTFLHETFQRIIVKQNGRLDEPHNRCPTDASVSRKTTIVESDLKFS